MKLLEWIQNRQRKQKEVDIMKSLYKYFEKVDKNDVGEFLINEEWYFTIYGCDSLQTFIDDIIINE